MSNINKNKNVLFLYFYPKYLIKYTNIYILNMLNMYKNKILIIQKNVYFRKCFQNVNKK